jgi:hypothetical protein
MKTAVAPMSNSIHYIPSGLSMNVLRFFFVSLIGSCTAGAVWSQSPGRQQEGLTSPLPIPLVLAGNFGELRTDHFHTGLDFKTQGREGIPVLAAADGVISRLKVSPYGYGNALYLNSPGGLTTVYAHLQKFDPAIEQWVLEEQYRLKQFAVNLYPKRSFSFEQGDTIGWSGNSGGSSGPHLHFEVRQTASEKPLNPLLWDFPIEDHRAPQLDALWFLPVNGAQIQGVDAPFRSSHSRDTIAISGSIRLAVEALDRLDGANNTCGVFAMEARLNGALWFSWQLDTLDFSLKLDMNAHAYFPVWEKQGVQVHRLHRLPGNRLPVYKESALSPELSLPTGEVAVVGIFLEDIHGNQTERTWIVKGGEAYVECMPHKLYPYDQSCFVLGEHGGSVSAPAHAFYDDFWLDLEDLGSGRWHVGTVGQAVRKKLTVRLPLPPLDSTETVPSRGWVATMREKDGALKAVYPATLSEGEAVFSTRKFGTYALELDTVPPSIEPNRVHLSASGSTLRMSGRSQLRFSVSDDLSGLEEINGYIDGSWVLFRWDPKRERIWYEKHRSGAEVRVEITAKDAVGNVMKWDGIVAFP